MYREALVPGRAGDDAHACRQNAFRKARAMQPRSIALTREVTAEDIMSRSINAFGTLLSLSVSVVCFGCERQNDPPVSRTEITSVDVAGAPRAPRAPDRSDQDLGAFRESALGDLANLDERLHRLELRAGMGAGAGDRQRRSEARDALDEARRRRDLLATRIEAMQAGTWQREREDVQRQWEEVSAIAERAGDLFSDDAR